MILSNPRLTKPIFALQVAGNFELALRMTNPAFQDQVRSFINRAIAPFKYSYPDPANVAAIEASVCAEAQFRITLFPLTLHI